MTPTKLVNNLAATNSYIFYSPTTANKWERTSKTAPKLLHPLYCAKCTKTNLSTDPLKFFSNNNLITNNNICKNDTLLNLIFIENGRIIRIKIDARVR